MTTWSQTSALVLESVKNVVEIIALIIAGMWAYAKFSETERPLLEFRGQVESTLKWFPLSDRDYCLGEFGVAIKNIGKTSFDVETVRLRVWLTPFPLAKAKVDFLDPANFQDAEPALDKEITHASLIGHYAPDVTSQYDYNFIFKKNPANVALVRFDAKTARGSTFTESRWDNLCAFTEVDYAKRDKKQ